VGKSTTTGLFLVVENYKVGSLFPYNNKVGGLPVFLFLLLLPPQNHKNHTHPPSRMHRPLAELPTDSAAVSRPWLGRPRDSTHIRPKNRRLLEQGVDAFVPCTEVTKYYGVSPATLRGWADAGTVRALRIGHQGQRLYNARDLRARISIVGPSNVTTTTTTEEAENAGGIVEPVEGSCLKKRFAYARVSSAHQRDALHRQVQELKRHLPGHEVVTDVASGLNWHRKGLRRILDDCFDGLVQEVAVLHRYVFFFLYPNPLCLFYNPNPFTAVCFHSP